MHPFINSKIHTTILYRKRKRADAAQSSSTPTQSSSSLESATVTLSSCCASNSRTRRAAAHSNLTGVALTLAKPEAPVVTVLFDALLVVEMTELGPLRSCGGREVVGERRATPPVVEVPAILV